MPHQALRCVIGTAAWSFRGCQGVFGQPFPAMHFVRSHYVIGLELKDKNLFYGFPILSLIFF